MWMPGIWSDTCNHVVSEDHADLGGLCFHQGHGDIWPQVAAKGNVWVHVTAIAEICVTTGGHGNQAC